MLQAATVNFLKSLRKNNNKVWFEANRRKYEEARADFTQFIQRVIDLHGKNDASVNHLTAKECLFRINRDVRFAKDKSPYKTNFGASINKSGRQSLSSAGYYFSLHPGESFAGGGIWMPPAPDLRKVRQEIDYNFDDFKKIIGSKKFKSIYGDLADDPEYKLVRLPKGYEPGNRAAEYLKLKSYIASMMIKDVDLTSKNLVKETVAAFSALQPLIIFINQSIQD
ncbi:MAG TPA: DUF2461 domain-containing protein [Chitinophagaceae bacterium]|nr:DUF2461 domain-containing protein [Chitinophagaceae bacterium]